jgi:hypothetical protein
MSETTPHTITFGFGNLNGAIGKNEDLIHAFTTNKISFFAAVETWLSSNSGERCPISGNIIGDIREPHIMNHLPGISSGRRAKGGILLLETLYHIQNTHTLPFRLLDAHPNAWWLIAAIGPLIVMTIYLPPTANNARRQALWDRRNSLILEHPTAPILICGDFNIRLGPITGDHAFSQNATIRDWMLGWTSAGWTLQQPSTGNGKYTTVNQNGKGITDYILTNEQATQVFSNFEVHETESMGGSDHRLLTFDMDIQASDLRPKFERINIRRLREFPEDYLKSLRASLTPVLDTLTQVASTVDNCYRQGNTMPYGERINLVSKCSTELNSAITNAATDAAGLFRFKGIQVTDRFNTPLISSLRTIADEAMTSATSAGVSTRAQRFHKARVSRRIYRKAVRRRRIALFRQDADALADSSGAAVKLVACQKARRDRAHCALDPTAMAQYEGHFQTTFGAAAGGTRNAAPQVLLETNPQESLLPYPNSTWLTEDTVETALGNMATGKAAGDDGLFGEMFSLASAVLRQPITKFFQILIRLAVIPPLWTQANVALVWKHKGQRTDIANYRPISLISVFRKLYEAVVLPQISSVISPLLDPAQGGFRTKRSCYDQLFITNELCQREPNPHMALLDIKAAYDCVNRELLWTDFYRMTQDNPNRNMAGTQLTMILRSLFDYNYAVLLVLGSKSAPIPVTRGLLQGTILAPLLFNVAINSLPSLLRDNHPTFRAGRFLTNSLLYADDTALLAPTGQDLANMLDTAETWATAHGILFAPTKCIALSDATNDLLLYQQALPRRDSATYLGMTISRSGVMMAESLAQRTSKARQMVDFLRSRGFNGWGWRPQTSLLIYQTFVRPILEYGVALRPLTVYEARPLEAVQNYALKSMVSTARSTSTNAVLLATGQLPMLNRARILHAGYYNRLHRSQDGANMAVSLYRSLIAQPRTKLPLLSLVRKTISTPLFRKLNLPPISSIHLSAVAPQQLTKVRIPVETRKTYYRDTMSKLTTGRIASGVPIPKYQKPHPLIRASFLPRVVQRDLILWLIGAVVRHQPCLGCIIHPELSRSHAVSCTNTSNSLSPFFPNIRIPNLLTGGTILEAAINRTPFSKEQGLNMQVRTLAQSVRTIRRHCLQHQGLRDITEDSNGQIATDLLSDLDSDDETLRSLRTSVIALVEEHGQDGPTGSRRPQQYNPQHGIANRGGRPRTRL